MVFPMSHSSSPFEGNTKVLSAPRCVIAGIDLTGSAATDYLRQHQSEQSQDIVIFYNNIKNLILLDTIDLLILLANYTVESLEKVSILAQECQQNQPHITVVAVIYSDKKSPNISNDIQFKQIDNVAVIFANSSTTQSSSETIVDVVTLLTNPLFGLGFVGINWADIVAFFANGGTGFFGIGKSTSTQVASETACQSVMANVNRFSLSHNHNKRPLNTWFLVQSHDVNLSELQTVNDVCLWITTDLGTPNIQIMDMMDTEIRGVEVSVLVKYD
jgi:hypothetical protein